MIAILYCNKGDAEMNLENFIAAESSFKEAITYEDDFSGGYMSMGRLRSQQKMYDDAIKLLEKALSLHQPTDSVHSLFNMVIGLAYCYNKTGQKEKEKEMMLKCLEPPLSSISFVEHEIN